VFEEVNRKLHAKNVVELLALYVDSERHNAQRYRRTDGQINRHSRHRDANSRSYDHAMA